MMNGYKPGQGFRVTLVSTVAGVFTDPSTQTVEMHLPDGTTTPGSAIKDSTGNWHADFLVPFTCPQGIGVYRWRSSGSTPDQDAVGEKRFQVEALDY